ncbi:MAG: TonB C-terminal domain-containing protein [Syntrophobacteraceae bacterium]|jgi:TonB family protein|nr:TonB C-terminal domain-containing protein [Syntrophobacteraceae bacterium]
MEENGSAGSSSSRWIWIASGAFVLGILLISALAIVRLVMNDDGESRKKRAQMVTLLRVPPPPPPKVEKPPEPEMKKKEEVVQPERKQAADESRDDKPAGKNLGVDAEGGAGSDGFGLVGNKGGRSLVGGGGAELMRQYAGYLKVVQDELRKRVQEVMERNGGIPRGKLQATVKIQLDQRGTVVHYQILASSGDSRMDQALRDALGGSSISQPPPEGMPRRVNIRISSQG